MDDQQDAAAAYKVVINSEEQYSIWRADRQLPPGWREVWKHGTKAECLAHIDEIWADMRPLSLRESMAKRGLIGS